MKANNDLGTEIDAPFSNLLPMAGYRNGSLHLRASKRIEHGQSAERTNAVGRAYCSLGVHALKLKGQSGTIPPIVLDAVATKNGAPGKVDPVLERTIERYQRVSRLVLGVAAY